MGHKEERNLAWAQLWESNPNLADALQASSDSAWARLWHNDPALASLLQPSDSDKEQTRSQEEEDEALARAIQAIEIEDPHHARTSTHPVQPSHAHVHTPAPYAGAYQPRQVLTARTPEVATPTFAEIQGLQTHLTTMAPMFQSQADIHTYTRPLGQLCREGFFPMDEKYQLSFFGDLKAEFNRICPFIEAMTPSGDKAVVSRVLGSISEKGATYIDDETRINMMSLLVKAWHLAEKSGRLENKGLIVDNLRHNIETNGGCYPGIAARLIHPYAMFLNTAMQQASGLYEDRPTYRR